jgi:hypothetical protein
MPFSFNAQKPKDITSSFTQLKNLLEEKGCSLKGDETHGLIIWSDGVEGTYTTKPSTFEITIEKNPFKINKPVEIYIRWFFRKIIRKLNSQEKCYAD